MPGLKAQRVLVSDEFLTLTDKWFWCVYCVDLGSDRPWGGAALGFPGEGPLWRGDAALRLLTDSTRWSQQIDSVTYTHAVGFS